MVNRPKAIGTAAETAVVRAARQLGFPQADRLTLTGNKDRGDVGLCPGVIIEVKGGEHARAATDLDIDRWLDETERERRHAFADVALLVVQRRGIGTPNAHRWWAWWRLGQLKQLRSPEPRCRACGCTDAQACPGGCAWRDSEPGPPCCTSCDPRDPEHLIPVQMQLGHALHVIRAAGYGQALAERVHQSPTLGRDR